MQVCCLLAGYVYATARTLAHVDLVTQVNAAGQTVTGVPSNIQLYGDCTAKPAVTIQLKAGIDQTDLAIGLAAALNAYFTGWNVST